MKKEIEFDKYKTKGSDYHFSEIKKSNLFNFNLFLYTRYILLIEKIEREILISRKKTINEPIRILDMGCGDGVFLYLFQKKYQLNNIELYGVDLDSQAILSAKAKVEKGKFFVSSVYKTKFKNNFFDIIVSSDVIEHLQYPRKMLFEIKRILKPKRSLFISTPIKLTEKPIDKMHVCEFFQNEFIELLLYFFKNVEIEESHPAGFYFLASKTWNIWRFKFPIFSYIFNALYIFFNINIFTKKSVKQNNDIYSYMIASCRK